MAEKSQEKKKGVGCLGVFFLVGGRLIGLVWLGFGPVCLLSVEM